MPKFSMIFVKSPREEGHAFCRDIVSLVKKIEEHGGLEHSYKEVGRIHREYSLDNLSAEIIFIPLEGGHFIPVRVTLSCNNKRRLKGYVKMFGEDYNEKYLAEL